MKPDRPYELSGTRAWLSEVRGTTTGARGPNDSGGSVTAIHTACYASNRLFVQKFLEKTPYELLNGKKPDVSFFRVFGCKCYIYKKRQHLEKFQRCCAIGFLLGYSSKSKAYRVFNHATGLVEETYDVEFDESNGSQGAHENLDDVGDEPLREAMKNIPIGDIKPKEDDDEV